MPPSENFQAMVQEDRARKTSEDLLNGEDTAENAEQLEFAGQSTAGEGKQPGKTALKKIRALLLELKTGSIIV